jgi:hypothetical protein
LVGAEVQRWVIEVVSEGRVKLILHIIDAPIVNDVVAQIVSCFYLQVLIDLLTLIGEGHALEEIHGVETSLNADVSEVGVVVGIGLSDYVRDRHYHLVQTITAAQTSSQCCRVEGEFLNHSFK